MRDRGQLGERIAEEMLCRRGYRILERNFRTPCGEIDLVAQDGSTLCFVEVKARSTCDLGEPEEAVTPAKRARLRAAARVYLASRNLAPESCRFDVVALVLDTQGRLSASRILHDAFV